MSKIIDIFTDGACRGNPGIGGWGALLRYGTIEKKLYGAEAYTTNNRMELTAVMMALRALKRPCYVNIVTDSQYVKNGMTQWMADWQKNHFYTKSKKPVKNIDLWQALSDLANLHQIQWHWVKGHSGHPENTLVDNLANQAIDQLLAELN